MPNLDILKQCTPDLTAPISGKDKKAGLIIAAAAASEMFIKLLGLWMGLAPPSAAFFLLVMVVVVVYLTDECKVCSQVTESLLNYLKEEGKIERMDHLDRQAQIKRILYEIGGGETAIAPFYASR